MEYKILDPIKPHHAGCLCCPGAGTELDMNTVLYNGFGGWHISKNGELYFMEDSNTEWGDSKTIAQIEQESAADPDNDWQAVCSTPLHGETYQRQNGKWMLVEQNLGFA